MPRRTSQVQFFKSPAELRRWLKEHHLSALELWIGFYKKDSGKGGLTYAEALDEALCFGWIDGIRQRVDEISYTNRFTPRRPKSIWSKINTGHAERLIKSGKMRAAGLEQVKLAKEDGRWARAYSGTPAKSAPKRKTKPKRSLGKRRQKLL